MHSLYLLIDLCAVAVPLAFSFHPKIKLSSEWLPLLAAMLTDSLFFVVWDVIFTNLQVWSFNPRYTMGVHLFNLPLEEVLFFICIPYACTFTYYSLNKLTWHDKYSAPAEKLSLAFGISLIVFGCCHFEKMYTFYSFLFCGVFLIVFRRTVEKAFYISYVILLVPFFIVNGILTGTGIDEAVVLYNSHQNLSTRLLTIPVEDSVYGMLMIFMNLLLFNRFITYSSNHFKTTNIGYGKSKKEQQLKHEESLA